MQQTELLINNIDKEILRELVRAGIQAISADNSQPWSFDLTNNGINLRITDSEPEIFFDPASVATLMSCGSVLENIRLSANSFGIRADIQRNPKWGYDHRIASLLLTKGSLSPDPLAAWIYQRATHRGYYQPWRRIHLTELQRLDAAASVYPENHTVWFCEAPKRRSLKNIITASERLRYTHEQIHREFHACLRFGRSANIQKDGLAWDTLGIERIFIPILKKLAPWPLTRRLNRLGLHYLMAMRSAWLPLSTAPVIGALIQKGEPDFLGAGQALQRIWLAANAQGLAFQPFGAFPLFLIRLRAVNGVGFRGTDKATLEKLREDFWRLTEYDSQTHSLMMLFRIGYASPLKAFSRRWPLNHFLVS